MYDFNAAGGLKKRTHAQVVERSHQTPFFDKFGAYAGDICGLACTHKVC